MKRVCFLMMLFLIPALIYSQETRYKSNFGVGVLQNETGGYFLEANLYRMKGSQGLLLGMSVATYKSHKTPDDYSSLGFFGSSRPPNDDLYLLSLAYAKEIKTFGNRQKILLSVGGSILYSIKQHNFIKESQGGWFAWEGYRHESKKEFSSGLNSDILYLISLSENLEIGAKVKMNYNGVNPFLGFGGTFNIK